MRSTASSAKARTRAGLGLAALVLLAGAGAPAAAAAPTRAKSARALYEEAREAERRLHKSEKLQASPAAWRRVAQSYHRVVLAHPRSGYCDDALYFEGEIYRELDRRFPNPNDVRRALDAYHLLVTGYPTSRWIPVARLARAELLAERRGQKDRAREELREIVRRWPSSAEAVEARRRLAALDPPPPRPAARAKAAPPGPGRVVVENIRHWTGKDYTRIVIDMDRETEFRRGRLTSPDRLYFDILDARLAPSLASRSFPVGDGLLHRIRVGQNRPDIVRVVLDFETIGEYNVFSLHDPYRLVVDILGARRDGQSPVAEGGTAPTPPAGNGGAAAPAADGEPDAPVAAKAPAPDIVRPLPPEPTEDGRFPLSRQLGLGARRVIIDPGHGGRDPGTIGPRGLKEKDLVLDISRRVARLLEEDGGFEVLMTRREDVFIPLEERTAVANSREADLFVSIHANASRNRKARGIETYYLNLATTPEAEAVAARENAVSTRRMGELQELLRKIMNNSKIAESREFATRIHRSLVEGVLADPRERRDLGVKTAPFYVLLGANMPAVLVEVSFLSNPKDAALLATNEYRQRLAEAIAEGIRSYSASLKRAALAEDEVGS